VNYKWGDIKSMSDEDNINKNNEKNILKNNSSNSQNNSNLTEFEKVKYFSGQLLLPEDFKDEQDYINNKRHLINKLVNGSGVVCGLGIDWLNSAKAKDTMKVPIVQGKDNIYKIKIRIQKGVAIDYYGKEIVVDEEKDKEVTFDKSFLDETKHIGLAISRDDQESRIVPNYLNSTTENKPDNSRIKEQYKIELQLIDQIPIKMEFDKKSYCHNEKVRLELWDPDNTVKSVQDVEEPDNKDNAVKSNIFSVKINISSNKDNEGIDIFLKKFKRKDGSYDDNLYKGEIFLIKNGKSMGNQLLVNDNDHLTAKYESKPFAHAYVNSSDLDYTLVDSSYINDSKFSFILNQKKMIDDFYKKQLLECTEFENSNELLYSSNNGNNNDNVILYVLKAVKDEGGEWYFEVDDKVTSLYKKFVYNNPLLYSLVKENMTCRKESELFNNCTVISDTYDVDISKLKPNSYLITNQIKIFDENKPVYSNKIVDGPPIIYLGRRTEEDNEKIMHYEDFDFNIVINTKKYKPHSADTVKITKEMNLNIVQSIAFKPIEITPNSFRLLVTKDYDTEDKPQETLLLRWWAICRFNER
jgi:hypothetical protein